MWTRVRIGILTIVCLAGALPSYAVMRVFVDSLPTTDGEVPNRRELILREIPRQLFLVTAAKDFGLICVDATAEPQAQPDKADLVLTPNGRAKSNDNYQVTLSSAKSDKPLAEVVLNFQTIGYGQPDYDDLTRRLDAKWTPKLIQALGKQVDATTKPVNWDAAGTVPPGLEARLESIDFHNAFLVAREMHKEIAESGESPARLAVLTRAYANLGDATRHVFTGQSNAFFARSMVYRMRLMQSAPKDPIAWWSAGYGVASFQHSGIRSLEFT